MTSCQCLDSYLFLHNCLLLILSRNSLIYNVRSTFSLPSSPSYLSLILSIFRSLSSIFPPSLYPPSSDHFLYQQVCTCLAHEPIVTSLLPPVQESIGIGGETLSGWAKEFLSFNFYSFLSFSTISSFHSFPLPSLPLLPPLFCHSFLFQSYFSCSYFLFPFLPFLTLLPSLLTFFLPSSLLILTPIYPPTQR